MREPVLGRLLRMIRLRSNLTQGEVSARAGLSTSVISRIENGQAGRYRLATIQRHGDALGIRIEISAMGRGGEIARLDDEEHAAIVEWLARTLTGAGWLVDPEVSFSVYGERGRIDLLAFHPPSGTLLIVEVKTELVDLQDLFGALDVKARHASATAAARGWRTTRTSTLVAVADTSANRELVRAHGTLFGRFERNAARIEAWFRRPRAAATSLLLYVAPEHGRRDAWLATRRRVRH